MSRLLAIGTYSSSEGNDVTNLLAVTTGACDLPVMCAPNPWPWACILGKGLVINMSPKL